MSIEEIRASFHYNHARGSSPYPIYERFHKVTVRTEGYHMVMWSNTDIYSGILMKLPHVNFDIISEAIERRSWRGLFNFNMFPDIPHGCDYVRKIQEELSIKLDMESIISVSFTCYASEKSCQTF